MVLPLRLCLLFFILPCHILLGQSKHTAFPSTQHIDSAILGQTTTQYKIWNKDTINRIDAQGRMQGLWMLTGFYFPASSYREDQIVEVGRYENSQRVGKWTTYFPNGNVSYWLTYDKGELTGDYSTYYVSGKLEEVGTLQQRHPVGKVRRYHENGVIASLQNFDSLGQQMGKYERFDAGGNLLFRGMVELDSIKGSQDEVAQLEHLWASKQLQELEFGSFHDGVLWSGESYWFDHGTLKAIVLFEHGVRLGDRLLDPTLKLSDPSPALKISPCTERDDAGRLIWDGLCKGEERINGKHYLYSDTGQLLEIETYRNGRLVSKKTINE